MSLNGKQSCRASANSSEFQCSRVNLTQLTTAWRRRDKRWVWKSSGVLHQWPDVLACCLPQRERLQRDVIMKNKEIKALQKELQLQQQLTATAEEGVRSACAWVAQLNRSTASPPPPPPAGIAKQAAAAAPTDAPTDASRATFHSPGPNRLAMAAHPVVSTPPDSANAARRCDDCTRLRERVEQLERAMQATSTAPTALKGDHSSFSPGGDVGGGFVGGGGGDGGGESGVGGGGGLMPRPQRGGIATERSGIPRMHAAELPDPLEEELAAAKAELRSLLSMEAPAIGVRRGGAARGGGYPGHVRAVDSPPAVSPFRVSSSRVSPSRVSPARVSPARVSPSPPRALSVPRHTPDRTRRFSGSRGHGSHDALSSTRRSLEERLDAELEAFSEEQQSQAQLLRASIAIMKKGLEYP